MLVGAAACSDHTTGPPDAERRLSLVAGDNQALDVVGTLPAALVVRSSNSAGQPLSGVSVMWEVLAGDGRLATAETRTDSRGEARATWELGAVADTQVMQAKVGGATVRFRALVSVARLDVRPAVTLGVGTAVRVTALAFDKAGQRLHATPILTSVDGPLQRLGAQWLQGTQLGVGTMVLAVQDRRASVAITVADVPSVISGRAFAADGALDAGTWVRRQDGDVAFATSIAPNGTFTVRARTSSPTGPIAFAGLDTTTRYLLSLIRDVAADSALAVRVLLYPRRWTIEKGFHAGQTIDVSIRTAFAQNAVRNSFFADQGFYPSFWASGVKAWHESAFPLPVAIDRSEIQLGIQQDWRSQDSTAMWRWLDELNAEAGRLLFRPAQYGDLNFVRQPGLGAGVSNVGVGAVLVAIWSRGILDRAFGGGIYDRDFSFRGARVGFETAGLLNDRFIVKHEFIHTLGIIHACGFRSLMSYCRDTSDELTPHDVAYLELLLRTTSLMRSERVRFTLWETAMGETDALARSAVVVDRNLIPAAALR